VALALAQGRHRELHQGNTVTSEPAGARPDWRLMALAAIREGICPEHKTPLDPHPRGGWCWRCGRDCGAWWTIGDDDNVVTTYPVPGWAEG
jgi:hypothetical protein